MEMPRSSEKHRKLKQGAYSPTDAASSDFSSDESNRRKTKRHYRSTSPTSSSTESSDDSSTSYEYKWEEAKPPKPPFQPFVTSVNIGATELPALKREAYAVVPLKAILVILFPNNTPDDLEEGFKKLDIYQLTKFEADLLTKHVQGLCDSGIRTFTVAEEIYVAEFCRGEVACSYESLQAKFTVIMKTLKDADSDDEISDKARKKELTSLEIYKGKKHFTTASAKVHNLPGPISKIEKRDEKSKVTSSTHPNTKSSAVMDGVEKKRSCKITHGVEKLKSVKATIRKRNFSTSSSASSTSDSDSTSSQNECSDERIFRDKKSPEKSKEEKVTVVLKHLFPENEGNDAEADRKARKKKGKNTTLQSKIDKENTKKSNDREKKSGMQSDGSQRKQKKKPLKSKAEKENTKISNDITPEEMKLGKQSDAEQKKEKEAPLQSKVEKENTKNLYDTASTGKEPVEEDLDMWTSMVTAEMIEAKSPGSESEEASEKHAANTIAGDENNNDIWMDDSKCTKPVSKESTDSSKSKWKVVSSIQSNDVSSGVDTESSCKHNAPPAIGDRKKAKNISDLRDLIKLRKSSKEVSSFEHANIASMPNVSFIFNKTNAVGDTNPVFNEETEPLSVPVDPGQSKTHWLPEKTEQASPKLQSSVVSTTAASPSNSPLELSTNDNGSNAEWKVTDSYSCGSPERQVSVELEKSPESEASKNDTDKRPICTSHHKKDRAAYDGDNRTRKSRRRSSSPIRSRREKESRSRGRRKSRSPERRSDYAHKGKENSRGRDRSRSASSSDSRGQPSYRREGHGAPFRTRPNSRNSAPQRRWRPDELYGGRGVRLSVFNGNRAPFQRTTRYVPDYSKLHFTYRPELYSPLSSSGDFCSDIDNEDDRNTQIRKHKVLRKKSSRDDKRNRIKSYVKEHSAAPSDVAFEKSSDRDDRGARDRPYRNVPKFPIRREISVEPSECEVRSITVNPQESVIPGLDICPNIGIENIVVNIRQKCGREDDARSSTSPVEYYPRRISSVRTQHSASPLKCDRPTKRNCGSPQRRRRRSHSPSCLRYFSPSPHRRNRSNRRRRSLSPLYSNQNPLYVGMKHFHPRSHCRTPDGAVRMHDCCSSVNAVGNERNSPHNSEMRYSSTRSSYQTELRGGSHTMIRNAGAPNELMHSRYSSPFHTSIHSVSYGSSSAKCPIDAQQQSVNLEGVWTGEEFDSTVCKYDFQSHKISHSDEEQVIFLKGDDLTSPVEDWPFFSGCSDHESSVEDSCDGEVESLMFGTLSGLRKKSARQSAAHEESESRHEPVVSCANNAPSSTHSDLAQQPQLNTRKIEHSSISVTPSPRGQSLSNPAYTDIVRTSADASVQDIGILSVARASTDIASMGANGADAVEHTLQNNAIVNEAEIQPLSTNGRKNAEQALQDKAVVLQVQAPMDSHVSEEVLTPENKAAVVGALVQPMDAYAPDEVEQTPQNKAVELEVQMQPMETSAALNEKAGPIERDLNVDSPCAYEEVVIQDHDSIPEVVANKEVELQQQATIPIPSEENSKLCMEVDARLDYVESATSNQNLTSIEPTSNGVEGEAAEDVAVDSDGICLGATITIEGNQDARENAGGQSNVKSWKKQLLHKAQNDASRSVAQESIPPSRQNTIAADSASTNSESAIENKESIKIDTQDEVAAEEIDMDTILTKNNADTAADKHFAKPSDDQLGASEVSLSETTKENERESVTSIMNPQSILNSNISACKTDPNSAPLEQSVNNENLSTANVFFQPLSISSLHSNEGTSESAAGSQVECDTVVTEEFLVPESVLLTANDATRATDSAPVSSMEKEPDKLSSLMHLDSLSSSESLDSTPTCLVSSTMVTSNRDSTVSTSVTTALLETESHVPFCLNFPSPFAVTTTACCSKDLGKPEVLLTTSPEPVAEISVARKNLQPAISRNMVEGRLNPTKPYLATSTSAPCRPVVSNMFASAKLPMDFSPLKALPLFTVTVPASSTTSTAVSMNPLSLATVSSFLATAASLTVVSTPSIPVTTIATANEAKMSTSIFEKPAKASCEVQENSTLSSSRIFGSSTPSKTIVNKSALVQYKCAGKTLESRSTFRGPQVKHNSAIQKTISSNPAESQNLSTAAEQLVLSNRPGFGSSRVSSFVSHQVTESGPINLNLSREQPSGTSPVKYRVKQVLQVAKNITMSPVHGSFKPQDVIDDDVTMKYHSPLDFTQPSTTTSYGDKSQCEPQDIAAINPTQKPLKSILRKPTVNFDETFSQSPSRGSAATSNCNILNPVPAIEKLEPSQAQEKSFDERLQEGDKVIHSLLPLIKSRRKPGPKKRGSSNNVRAKGHDEVRKRASSRGRGVKRTAGRGRGRPKRRKRLPSISSDEDIIEELNAGATHPVPKENSPPPESESSESQEEDGDEDLVSFMGATKSEVIPSVKVESGDMKAEIEESAEKEEGKDDSFFDGVMDSDSDDDLKPLSELAKHKDTHFRQTELPDLPVKQTSDDLPLAQYVDDDDDENIFTKMSREIERSNALDLSTVNLGRLDEDSTKVDHRLSFSESAVKPREPSGEVEFSEATQEQLPRPGYSQVVPKDTPVLTHPTSDFCRRSTTDEVQPILPTPPSSPKPEESNGKYDAALLSDPSRPGPSASFPIKKGSKTIHQGASSSATYQSHSSITREETNAVMTSFTSTPITKASEPSSSTLAVIPPSHVVKDKSLIERSYRQSDAETNAASARPEESKKLPNYRSKASFGDETQESGKSKVIAVPADVPQELSGSKNDGIADLIAAAAKIAGVTNESGTVKNTSDPQRQLAKPLQVVKPMGHRTQDGKGNTHVQEDSISSPRIRQVNQRSQVPLSEFSMPESDSCHGFLEVSMSAPLNRTYALRRIPYVKTTSHPDRFASSPNFNFHGQSGAFVDSDQKFQGSNPILPTSSACATYLRIRDLITLIKVHPESLFSLVVRCDTTLYLPNEYTRRLFSVVYDPVSETDMNLAKMMHRHTRGERLQQFLEHMIVLDKFLHSILPKFYYEAMGVAAADVPKFVTVKIFKPISNIDEEIMKIFRKPYEYNSVLRSKDEKVKCQPIERRRFSKYRFNDSSSRTRSHSSDSSGSLCATPPTIHLGQKPHTQVEPTRPNMYQQRPDSGFSLEQHPQGFYMPGVSPQMQSPGIHNFQSPKLLEHHVSSQQLLDYRFDGNVQTGKPEFPNHGMIFARAPLRYGLSPVLHDMFSVAHSQRQLTMSSSPQRLKVVSQPTDTLVAGTNVIRYTGSQNNNSLPLSRLSARVSPQYRTMAVESTNPSQTSSDSHDHSFFQTSTFETRKEETVVFLDRSSTTEVPCAATPQTNNSSSVLTINNSTNISAAAKPSNVSPRLLTTKEYLSNASDVLNPKNKGETGLVQKLRSRNIVLKSGLSETRDYLSEPETNDETGKLDGVIPAQKNSALSGIDILAEAAAKVCADSRVAPRGIEEKSLEDMMVSQAEESGLLSGVVSKLSSRVVASETMNGKGKRRRKNPRGNNVKGRKAKVMKNV